VLLPLVPAVPLGRAELPLLVEEELLLLPLPAPLVLLAAVKSGTAGADTGAAVNPNQ